MNNSKQLSLGKIIDEIAHLEHFRSFNCVKCGTPVRYHALEIYASCQKCNTRHKVRSVGGIGTEIQDVIDAVLEWAGKGEALEAVLRRHKELQEDADN